MEDISLHVLDIVENSLRAGARNVTVRLVQNDQEDVLILEVLDDGVGMNEDATRNALDPFYTTKGEKKVGLGLALLAQSAAEAEGTLRIESKPGKGTEVIASFKLSHVDRKPLGDLKVTMKCLRATHPNVSFFFEHECNP